MTGYNKVNKPGKTPARPCNSTVTIQGPELLTQGPYNPSVRDNILAYTLIHNPLNYFHLFTVAGDWFNFISNGLTLIKDIFFTESNLARQKKIHDKKLS